MEALGAFARAEDVELDRKLYTMIELEGQRYGGFFAKLDARGEGTIPRAAAVAFFAKSALSDAQVAELYERIKGVGLLPDPERVNVAEFTMAMHLIVCITKRNLVKIPLKFPTYLFPTLDLTPAKASDDDVWSSVSAATTPSASAFSAFPSPSPSPSAPSSLLPGVVTGFAAMNMNGSNDSYHDTPKLRMEDLSTSSSSLSAALSASKLTEARSLTELVHTEVRHRKVEATSLVSLEHSESRTLQNLHSCMDQIASQVDALGFPVPSTSRTLDALDDLNNLFAKHVHAIKQEIQSMEISAQMMSVASERTESMRGVQEKSDPLKQVASLTEELVRLQEQVHALFTRRDALAAQVEAAEAASRTSVTLTPPVVVNPTPSVAGVGATPTPSLDAYSTFAQSGGSSSTDVFSVTSSATNVTSDTKADDPWAGSAASVPATPAVAEATTQPLDGFGLSASLPSPPTTNAFADDWGTFSAPPLQHETVPATPAQATNEAATKPEASSAFADDWGTFSAPSSQQEPALATPATTIPDKDEAVPKLASSSAFADDWGAFSGPSSQQESAQAAPVVTSTDATKPADGLTLPLSQSSPATSSAFADEWGTFSSTPSQQQNGSANRSASADPFGFGSPLAVASPPPAGAISTTDAAGSVGQPTTAVKDEFGWGDFQ